MYVHSKQMVIPKNSSKKEKNTKGKFTVIVTRNNSVEYMKGKNKQIHTK